MVDEDDVHTLKLSRAHNQDQCGVAICSCRGLENGHAVGETHADSLLLDFTLFSLSPPQMPPVRARKRLESSLSDDREERKEEERAR
jgi:hypothetical protein